MSCTNFGNFILLLSYESLFKNKDHFFFVCFFFSYVVKPNFAFCIYFGDLLETNEQVFENFPRFIPSDSPASIISVICFFSLRCYSTCRTFQLEIKFIKIQHSRALT